MLILTVALLFTAWFVASLHHAQTTQPALVLIRRKPRLPR